MFLLRAPRLFSFNKSRPNIKSQLLSKECFPGIHASFGHCCTVPSESRIDEKETYDLLFSLWKKENEGFLLRNKLAGLESVSAHIKYMFPRFLVNFPRKLQLLVDRGVPRDKIVHVLTKVKREKALGDRSLDEIDKIITFLKPFDGTGLLVRHPQLLHYDLDTQLIPRIEVLLELSGGDEDGIRKLLYKRPTTLNYSAERVQGHIEFWRSFAGLNDQEIFRIILAFPTIITYSKERRLHPRIQFLKECGLDSSDIFKFLIKAPLFLSHSFREKLAFLIKIGYKYRTKDLAMAIGSTVRTNCKNLQQVISLLLSYGFSCEDILAMSKQHPLMLQHNHTSIEKKMKYLIENMNRDIEELLVFPAFLSYHFNIIKHRHEANKSTNGAKPLNQLLSVSEEKFTGKH